MRAVTKKKATAGKYQKNSAKFGFQAWGLETEESFNNLMMKFIKEGLDLATEKYECTVSFPVMWNDSDGYGGEPPKDATTLYISLPLGAEEYEEPRWSVSLADIIDDMISGGFNGEDNPGIVRLRDELAKIVDRLDAAIPAIEQREGKK